MAAGTRIGNLSRPNLAHSTASDSAARPPFHDRAIPRSSGQWTLLSATAATHALSLRGRRVVCAKCCRASEAAATSALLRDSPPQMALSHELIESEATAELRRKAARAAFDLRENGWAKVEDVIPREDCEAYQASFWDWLEGLGTGIDRSDPNTWKSPAWPPSFRGIINSLEVAHQAFVWRIRKHPRLVQIFAELWGTPALLSSFDSINALAAGAEAPQQAWLHVDQAPWRRGVCCVQGLVNLAPAAAGTTGTLLVKNRSHLEHDTFFSRVSEMSAEEQRQYGDHYKFSKREAAHWDSFEGVGVQGGMGSLFLWDSRTVHANVFPRQLSAFRHVVYTCYQPAAMASEADLEQKRRAYREHLLTTHWPAMNIRLYDRDQAVEYYGVEGAAKLPEYAIRRTRREVEDRRLLQLAGIEPYSPEEAAGSPPLLEMADGELQRLANV